MHDVASKNMAEIELSRMALDKSASPEVKAFAQMMIDDDGAAEDKLKSVLSGHALDWPAQLDDKHRETADDLAKEQGPDFDREYAKAMVEVHQDLAAKLESRLDVKSLAGVEDGRGRPHAREDAARAQSRDGPTCRSVPTRVTTRSR